MGKISPRHAHGPGGAPDVFRITGMDARIQDFEPMGQSNALTSGTPEKILSETRRLFEGFGKDGGYLCPAGKCAY
jgi:hypothetical protein